MASQPQGPSLASQPGGPDDAKQDLRRRVREARRSRGTTPADAAAIARAALAWEPVRRARTVAAYVSVGPEPPTGGLLAALLAGPQPRRVLVPVVLPDRVLDWAAYEGPDALATAGFGLLEPTGPRLDPSAIAEADVVLAPGLAVSATGLRLGHGGGFYDRALSLVDAATPVAVTLYDDEVGLDVPAEPHDRAVSHALTPSGVRTLG